MKAKIALKMGCVCIISLLVGCSGSEPAKPPATQQPTASVEQPAPPPPPPPTETAKTPNTIEKKADVGVGKRGRGYGKGVIVTPVATLFAVRERVVFTIQIPEAMKLFKATEDRIPKSHEEFMEQIIKANNIRLPDLPDGDRYMYDPKTGELMVESPVKE